MDQLKRFKRRFLWFWIGMLCLYVSFACQHTYEASFAPANEPAGKEISLSLAGSSHGQEGEFKGKLNLNITDEAHKAPSENLASVPKKSGQEKLHVKLVFSSLAFFFNNFTLLFVFSCFLVMYIRPGEAKKARKYLVGAVIVVGSLIILFFSFLVLKWETFTPKSAGDYVAIFDALSGVINAVVLALLIARLDSKLVGLPSWLISILYSYAAVQPLFLVFELSDSELLKTITTVVLIFVFISKIYFFLIIFYTLQTGKMLNYLTCFPILRKRAEEPAGSADTRSSALKRLVTLGLSVLRPNTNRRGKTRQKHVAASIRSLRSYPTEISMRLGMAVSRALRNRRFLDASELLGGLTILYFFISMIGPQVLSGADLFTAGTGSAAVYSAPDTPDPPATFNVIVASHSL